MVTRHKIKIFHYCISWHPFQHTAHCLIIRDGCVELVALAAVEQAPL